MSHLAPQAAIFSPSIARAAASTAKDWAYVDAWLRRQYAHLASAKPTAPPSFERNPETLEVLLSLIAANEEADEERDRRARLEASALDEVRAAEAEKARRRQNTDTDTDAAADGNSSAGDHGSTATTPPPIHGDLLAEDLLQAVDAGLSKEGLTALDALADVSLSLDAATDPSPANLSHRFVELQGRVHEAEHLLHRVGLLRSHLADESTRLSSLLEELRLGPQYQLVNASESKGKEGGREREGETGVEELELAVKSMASRLPELTRYVETLEKRVGIPTLTVEDVRRDEEAYLDLLARKKDLDALVRAFAGLPPDVEAARAELEGLRAQLREATERRDANFEMLVERESPVKTRASRRF
ncbi:hypothetical protein F4859DRAFT_494770 [Xylaria cf. heliscus]|nr:hypothetical protein F4859DRAFT_494770 [Xylaria cf. heliscus]